MVLRKITKIEFCRNGSDSLRLLQQTVFLFYYFIIVGPLFTSIQLERIMAK